MTKVEEIEAMGYGPVDVEMTDAINKLNTVPGVKTFDSCFGHPGNGTECNHHTHFFIGLKADDQELFDKFWFAFFDQYRGKVRSDTGYFQYTLTVGLYHCYAGIRLDCGPQHDPGTDERGVTEKKAALRLLCDFVDEYLANP